MLLWEKTCPQWAVRASPPSSGVVVGEPSCLVIVRLTALRLKGDHWSLRRLRWSQRFFLPCEVLELSLSRVSLSWKALAMAAVVSLNLVVLVMRMRPSSETVKHSPSWGSAFLTIRAS